MTDDRQVVAAFDVDGTLTTRDCVRPFLQRVGGRTGVVMSVLRTPAVSLMAAVRRDRDAVKAIVVGGVMRGRRVADVEDEGQRFARFVAERWIRPDTAARLRWHQRQGHRTVLVSASLGSYLRPLGATLGVDAVICTEVRQSSGVFTDQLDGPNCRAAEKQLRLERWFAEQSLVDPTLWAYGDSAGDRQLLGMATFPNLVKGTAISEVPIERAA